MNHGFIGAIVYFNLLTPSLQAGEYVHGIDLGILDSPQVWDPGQGHFQERFHGHIDPRHTRNVIIIHGALRRLLGNGFDPTHQRPDIGRLEKIRSHHTQCIRSLSSCLRRQFASITKCIVSHMHHDLQTRLLSCFDPCLAHLQTLAHRQGGGFTCRPIDKDTIHSLAFEPARHRGDHRGIQVRLMSEGSEGCGNEFHERRIGY